MPSYLCISVTFLDPAFHGRGDGGEPEWPPSPLRLFQALVAAAATRWRGPQFADYAAPALKWLEAQSPPVVVAPPHHVGVPVRVAVPNNDLDVPARFWAQRREPPENKNPQRLKTMKTVRPTRLTGGDAVHYLWELPDPLPDEVRGFAETLSAAARSVVALGWGVDLVAGHGRVIDQKEADRLPGERWRPTTDPAAATLRAPAFGTLEALTRRHADFLNRLTPDGFAPVPPLSAFAVVGYRRPTDVAGLPFAAFELWKPAAELAELPPGKSKFRPFDPTRAAAVAGMVRHAVAELARQARPFGWTDEDINTFVHGHTEDGRDRLRGGPGVRRFAYLPLPSITPRKVEAVRRVLIVGPPDGRAEVGWVRQAASGRELIDQRTGRPAAMLSVVSDRDPQVRQYTGPSAVWSTVTPVVMPGHDDGDPAKAERLLRKALEQAGLPPELVRSAELERQAVGFRPGVDLARRYRLPESLSPRPTCHVRVRFPVPIRGPLAVGAGRYRGLGVFVDG